MGCVHKNRRDTSGTQIGALEKHKAAGHCLGVEFLYYLTFIKTIQWKALLRKNSGWVKLPMYIVWISPVRTVAENTKLRQYNYCGMCKINLGK